MATSAILSNPTVTVNAVSLTDQCTSAQFTERYAELTATSFGDLANKYVKGLGNHELVLTLYMSYAANETYAAASATNPGFTLTGAFLAELPHNFAMGELSTIDVTFHGGVYSADIT